VTISYSEALDEALCFGWIDGVRRSVDGDSYRIRLTPRKPKSVWSRVNVARVRDLVKRGRMHASGLAAFERRDEEATERRSDAAHRKLRPADERAFKLNKKAWDFFRAQPPYYRRVASFWVVSAKKEETRQRRLAALIECSARGERLPQATGKARGSR
jgi:uncharacterized protein YdeI (YjbR/CyaY-like superfamily)